MATADLKDVSTHFAFGENWRDYSKHIDSEAISQAEKGLLKLISAEEMKSKRFLDIGCGSGIHSLAALRLGAAHVTGMDIDRNSVETARDVLNHHAPDSAADIIQMSVFDIEVSKLGTYDIVYSWGVLHHTGDMWMAIERALQVVRPGGLFAIALYQKCPTCTAWRGIKRFYSASPSLIQLPIKWLYMGAYMLRLLAAGQNPVTFVKNYKGGRGMNYSHDAHDWLGGYPYESAYPEAVEAYMTKSGFKKLRTFPLPKSFGLFGTGCAEYVFMKPGGENGNRCSAL